MHLLGSTAVILLLLGSGGPETAAEGGQTPACAPAAIEDVRLPGEVEVDEIRVELQESSPAAGAARIEVTAGEFERVLRVRGAAEHRLAFQPALFGASYRIHVDPVLSAPASACVERVELRSAGNLIAAVEM